MSSRSAGQSRHWADPRSLAMGSHRGGPMQAGERCPTQPGPALSLCTAASQEDPRGDSNQRPASNRADGPLQLAALPPQSPPDPLKHPLEPQEPRSRGGCMDPGPQDARPLEAAGLAQLTSWMACGRDSLDDLWVRGG